MSNQRGGASANVSHPRPKKFAGLANFALFLVFSIEVALTAMTIWFFLRPFDPSGQARDGFPTWWVENYGWLWGSAVIALVSQIIMLIVPLFIPITSPYAMWRNIVSFMDSFTNYFGFLVFVVYVMGFSSSLKVISEYIFTKLSAGDILTLIVIAGLAEATKQISHMMMHEDKTYQRAGGGGGQSGGGGNNKQQQQQQ